MSLFGRTYTKHLILIQIKIINIIKYLHVFVFLILCNEYLLSGNQSTDHWNFTEVSDLAKKGKKNVFYQNVVVLTHGPKERISHI